MSDKRVTFHCDVESVVATILLFALIVLCAGEPDLLDAIAERVRRTPAGTVEEP